MEFKPGRPSLLTPEKHAEIIAAVPHYIIQTQIAYACRLYPGNISEWLKRGESEQKEGISSIYTQFSADFHAARAAIVRESLAYLQCCPKNSAALIWVLEKCFREDFGTESTELRELRELFFKILPTIMNKGASANDEIIGEETRQDAQEGIRGTEGTQIPDAG